MQASAAIDCNEVFAQMRLVGVISDTHGLLRPHAVAALRGCDPIIHAGDVGRPDLLVELARVAPVIAVRGNVDGGAWARRLPDSKTVQVEGFKLYVLHNLDDLDVDLQTAGFDAVIFGHSHQPRNARIDNVLHFNPGSAGPRRFKLPVTVGRLTLAGRELHGEIIELSA
jgi:putative phosphoesterase